MEKKIKKKWLTYKNLLGEKKLFNPNWLMMDSRRVNLDTNNYLYRINRFQFLQNQICKFDRQCNSLESYFLLKKQLLLNIIRMQYVNFWKEKKYLRFFSFQALLIQERFGVLYPRLLQCSRKSTPFPDSTGNDSFIWSSN